MMEPLTLGIVRSRASSSGDSFDVLSDFGSGKIETGLPLNESPLPFFSHAGESPLHGESSHLHSAHLDIGVDGGHLDGPHLLVEHMQPAGTIDFVTPPMYFGAIQFAIQTYRGAHRATSIGETITMVANSAPRPVYRVDSVAMSDGVVSLLFEASPDLA